MKNSWLYKLIGAFLLIIVVGGLVMSLISSRATQKAFLLYTTRSGQLWAKRLAPDLVEFYELNQNWQGVDVFLQTSWTSSNMQHQVMMNQGAGKGYGQGQTADNSMMGALGQRLILADDQGSVIYDSLGKYSGLKLTSDDLKNGIAIISASKQVGTLLISPANLAESNSLINEFQISVRRAIIGSAFVAGLTALALGIFLFFQITAPMRQLEKAASAIANGDLSQRVEIRGKDEFAQLGETFNLMALNLSQAEIHRQHLMADVAHELRTPLTAIQGTVEGLQDGVLPVDSEQLNALLAETTLLNRLIEDLRLLSLAETNQLKLRCQSVDLNELINQIIERIQPQARLKDIHLEQHLQADLPVLQIDPDRITQIFTNLITNALRYTPKDGVIQVSTTQQNPRSPVRIEVTDTGTGINPEDIPYVFDRFYRADKSRSRASGGSGLGLAIVKELVDAHGGTIKVESPVFKTNKHIGFGTRMVMEFPI